MRRVLLAVPLLALALSLAWSGEQATVVRVVDGDTLVVSIAGREERVRLIGVDTPETVHPQKPVEYFGKEASAFTKRLAEGAVVRQPTLRTPTATSTTACCDTSTSRTASC